MLQFDDDEAKKRTNDKLKKGWKLLYAGTKTSANGEGQLIQDNFYIVGADSDAYKKYQKEQS